jgi:hypothetical protein
VDATQVFKDKIIVKGPWIVGEDADSMWNKMSTHIRKVTIDVFEVTGGNKFKPKGRRTHLYTFFHF